MTVLLDTATRKVRDREVTYIWKSLDLSTVRMGETDLWGEMIQLSFTHNPKRKQYEATIRRVLWQPSGNMEVWSFEVFNRTEYPAVTFATLATNRYSDKAFADFERAILGNIETLEAENEVLADLLARTLTY